MKDRGRQNVGRDPSSLILHLSSFIFHPPFRRQM